MPELKSGSGSGPGPELGIIQLDLTKLKIILPPLSAERKEKKLKKIIADKVTAEKEKAKEEKRPVKLITDKEKIQLDGKISWDAEIAQENINAISALFTKTVEKINPLLEKHKINTKNIIDADRTPEQYSTLLLKVFCQMYDDLTDKVLRPSMQMQGIEVTKSLTILNTALGLSKTLENLDKKHHVPKVDFSDPKHKEIREISGLYLTILQDAYAKYKENMPEGKVEKMNFALRPIIKNIIESVEKLVHTLTNRVSYYDLLSEYDRLKNSITDIKKGVDENKNNLSIKENTSSEELENEKRAVNSFRQALDFSISQFDDGKYKFLESKDEVYKKINSEKQRIKTEIEQMKNEVEGTLKDYQKIIDKKQELLNKKSQELPPEKPLEASFEVLKSDEIKTLFDDNILQIQKKINQAKQEKNGFSQEKNKLSAELIDLEANYTKITEEFAKNTQQELDRIKKIHDLISQHSKKEDRIKLFEELNKIGLNQVAVDLGFLKFQNSGIPFSAPGKDFTKSSDSDSDSNPTSSPGVSPPTKKKGVFSKLKIGTSKISKAEKDFLVMLNVKTRREAQKKLLSTMNFEDKSLHASSSGSSGSSDSSRMSSVPSSLYSTPGYGTSGTMTPFDTSGAKTPMSAQSGVVVSEITLQQMREKISGIEQKISEKEKEIQSLETDLDKAKREHEIANLQEKFEIIGKNIEAAQKEMSEKLVALPKTESKVLDREKTFQTEEDALKEIEGHIEVYKEQISKNNDQIKEYEKRANELGLSEKLQKVERQQDLFQKRVNVLSGLIERNKEALASDKKTYFDDKKLEEDKKTYTPEVHRVYDYLNAKDDAKKISLDSLVKDVKFENLPTIFKKLSDEKDSAQKDRYTAESLSDAQEAIYLAMFAAKEQERKSTTLKAIISGVASVLILPLPVFAYYSYKLYTLNKEGIQGTVLPTNTKTNEKPSEPGSRDEWLFDSPGVGSEDKYRALRKKIFNSEMLEIKLSAVEGKENVLNLVGKENSLILSSRAQAEELSEKVGASSVITKILGKH